MLHTSDIHAQLNTHDQFFYENNRAVYKNRGGFPAILDAEYRWDQDRLHWLQRSPHGQATEPLLQLWHQIREAGAQRHQVHPHPARLRAVHHGVRPHMGLAQQVNFANQPELDGADLILGADTHERVRKPNAGEYCSVTEPRAFGSAIARLDVIVEDGLMKDRHYELWDVGPETYPADPSMLQLVDEVSAPYKVQLNTVGGSTKHTLLRYYVIENPMDNLITDAMMWKLKPDVAISNGFRFCPPITADGNTPTPIAHDHIWSMIPVDSEAKYGEATGLQLWDWLQQELHNVVAADPTKRFGGWVVRFKGMTASVTMRAEQGRRVNWIRIGETRVDLARTYLIAACEREGAPDDTLCRMAKGSARSWARYPPTSAGWRRTLD